MIVSNLIDWNKEQAAFHPIFNQVIDYIKTHDLSSLDVGKHTIIPDKLFFFMQIYQTIELHESKPESHIQFIDLQYLLSGEETIGFSRTDKTVEITEDKTKTNDMIYYHLNTQQNVLTMRSGDLCIFLPDDIHRTRGHAGAQVTIKKAVFKIHLSLLG